MYMAVELRRIEDQIVLVTAGCSAWQAVPQQSVHFDVDVGIRRW